MRDCTGVVTDIGTNGRLPAAALCDLWRAPYQDRADAVVSLFALNDAYRAAFGRDMCLSSGYRDLAPRHTEHLPADGERAVRHLHVGALERTFMEGQPGLHMS